MRDLKYFPLQWAVELLGRISSKYADRGGVPHSSLNDVLQLWMTCPATKALIDLASQCFSSMLVFLGRNLGLISENSSLEATMVLILKKFL